MATAAANHDSAKEWAMGIWEKKKISACFIRTVLRLLVVTMLVTHILTF